MESTKKAGREELKKQILAAATKKHQTVVEDLARGIKDMVARDGVVNEDDPDRSQQAVNSEATQKANYIGSQLAFANEELRLLVGLASTIAARHRSVQLGSVVITDKGTFFICASIEEFRVGGENYFGISTHAPIYGVMKGKKAGDHFTYNHRRYTILDVF